MNSLKDYLETRRSALSITLEAPGPDTAQVEQMIALASRVPDHGKLAPWRFVLLEPAIRRTMHEKLTGLLERSVHLHDQPKKQAGTDKLLHAPCVIAVISTASEHPKIPVWEQQLSAGAVCMNMLISANAMGFEAQWLTAWYIYEDEARDILRLHAGERIAGLIHIGSSSVAKTERPRPAVKDILSIPKN